MTSVPPGAAPAAFTTAVASAAPVAEELTPLDCLARLAPISLDELVSEAELLTRVDRKYLIPVATATALLERIDSRARVLEIDGRRDFSYDSVYFDTPDHLSFRLTAQRRRRRFKLRTRSYLDTGSTFLELKTKSGRGTTVKERVAYAQTDRATLTAAGRRYVAAQFAHHGHDAALVATLRPTLVSQYQRTTLLMPEGSRATIDTRLRWSDGTDHGGAVACGIGLPDHVILESKSAGRASELDRALWRAGYRPSGISKFGTGTAALHPELPSNKWARTLAGPFATATPLSMSRLPAPPHPVSSTQQFHLPAQRIAS
ncbi:VTC domain-containing protein [Leucobacter luti]|uniref:VTC domain-containing protein n=1 Tax=Leucobacter luti TaxID=340320 RepID=A0A4R6S3F4_9MICO|nr:polyphosphate polymerase domain-containing protein [Leucobacter luti]TDP93205.1 VTC domain-containing protein [Leucobacter luti]